MSLWMSRLPLGSARRCPVYRSRGDRGVLVHPWLSLVCGSMRAPVRDSVGSNSHLRIMRL